MLLKRVIAAALSLFAIACSDLAVDNEPIVPRSGVQEAMSDPCPTCDGIFLTYTASDQYQCITSTGNDRDFDGVDDSCEYRVAQAFAPELVFHPNETQQSRETYWAVRRSSAYGASEWALDIAYLLGYHDDTHHDGDSEIIQLTVEFDTTATTGGIAGRWKFYLAVYSAHNGTSSYGADFMQWVNDQEKDRPVAWVAKGKHANYSSSAECESGNFGTDYCQNGFRQNVQVLSTRNIGSWYYHGTPFKNYVFSTTGDPNFLHPETMWARSGEFCGWQELCRRDVPRQHIPNYGERLEALGWITPPITIE